MAKLTIPQRIPNLTVFSRIVLMTARNELLNHGLFTYKICGGVKEILSDIEMIDISSWRVLYATR
jgi:hypothetical protein